MGVFLKRCCVLLLLLGLVACNQEPPPYVSKVDASEQPATAEGPPLGPLATALHAEIVEALRTTEWPQLNPTLEEVISGG